MATQIIKDEGNIKEINKEFALPPTLGLSGSYCILRNSHSEMSPS